ncbi:MAG: hypothetical protein ACI83D_000263 [Planctomycetota bacterium]|jgi:hypothetical protein
MTISDSPYAFLAALSVSMVCFISRRFLVFLERVVFIFPTEFIRFPIVILYTVSRVTQAENPPTRNTIDQSRKILTATAPYPACLGWCDISFSRYNIRG